MFTHSPFFCVRDFVSVIFYLWAHSRKPFLPVLRHGLKEDIAINLMKRKVSLSQSRSWRFALRVEMPQFSICAAQRHAE